MVEKWKTRQLFFDVDDETLRTWPDGMPLTVKYPFDERVRDIGLEGDPPPKSPLASDGDSGARLSESEARTLEDLLRRSLRRSPERRISAQQVMEHAWLTQTS